MGAQSCWLLAHGLVLFIYELRGYITGLVQERVEGEPTGVSLVKHRGKPIAEVKMLLPTFNNIFKMETLYLE